MSPVKPEGQVLIMIKNSKDTPFCYYHKWEIQFTHKRCGEIFADESSAHLELENSKELLLRRTKQKESPVLGSFQGGVEQLASPAQNEAADFAKFWDNINKSVRLHQSALFDKKLLEIPSPDLGKVANTAAASVPDLQVSPDKDCDHSKESSIDTGTPKSDHQESTSTSDEGYYDSFSPGQDDETKEAQTPGIPGRFPRDSYSGDALYELFYDPNEAKINPILDDELCLSESVSEQAIEIPLSIYSFHVGAEENMASQPAVDFISQGFLHSTWKGKECLLKLCDTELSLTMGIINWLRKHSGKGKEIATETWLLHLCVQKPTAFQGGTINNTSALTRYNKEESSFK
ncbi:APC membrane recruitment protein 3 [Alligator mississippiensis]|uniref:APC membrane recruitment protein 3 n=1 Tax=Alligator mississippiensis TaxID=8496 RepID=A0A151NU58_ALLMI|nr:APC membrane recruitment protein 3 [Alligator mississippiensis]